MLEKIDTLFAKLNTWLSWNKLANSSGCLMAPVQEHHKVKGLYLKRLNDGYIYVVIGQIVVLLITFLYSKNIIDYFKILQLTCYFLAAAVLTFCISFLVVYFTKYFSEKNVLIKSLIRKMMLKTIFNSFFLFVMGWSINKYYRF